MIGTSKSAVLNIAVLQRAAAMGTVQTEQTDGAMVIAKQDQLFAEHSDRLRNIAQITLGADREPMVAKPLAHRGARPDMG